MPPAISLRRSGETEHRGAGATPGSGYQHLLRAVSYANPSAGTYQAYNYISKKTDMDYVRVEGDLFGFRLDDTAYTYAYVNKTVTATNIEQTFIDYETCPSTRNMWSMLTPGE